MTIRPEPRPVRVAQLTSAHPVFDARIFHKECASLVRAGHDVVLIAVHDRDEEVRGVRVVALPRPSSRLARMAVTPWRLLRRALAQQADVYHFHDPELIPVGLALKLAGRRVVYDVHEDVPLDLLTKTYLPGPVRRILSRTARTVHRFADRAFDGIVVVTPSVGEPFRSPTLVRNYPSLAEFGAAPPPYAGRDAVVVYVGVITALRGFHQMVEAVGLLDGGCSPQLLLAGTVNPPELLAGTPAAGRGSRVRHVGVLDRDGVQRLLHSARIGLVVLPGDNPGFRTAYPIKLFEYMAAGLPVVASDFPVYREIVDGAGCGLVVDPSDPSAIAAAIQHLLDHPDEAEEMGRRGRAAVLDRFNWESEIGTLVGLYRAILS